MLNLLRELRMFPHMLVGHSFGGKVVMSMAHQFGASLPRPVQVRGQSSPWSSCASVVWWGGGTTCRTWQLVCLQRVGMLLTACGMAMLIVLTNSRTHFW